jgi:hypothetical protein
VDQHKFEEEMALNRKAYESLREQIRREYAGRYVAIAHGRFVTSAPTFEEASAAVLQMQPPPEHFLVFPAEDEPMIDVYSDTYSEYL